MLWSSTLTLRYAIRLNSSSRWLGRYVGYLSLAQKPVSTFAPLVMAEQAGPETYKF